MTDEQIIEALEEAIDKAEANGSIEEFVLTLSRGTVEDIIKAYNRQKAEIERLEKELDTELNHNDRLYKMIDRLIAGACNITKIKSEAIKEFWERLKAQNTMDRRIISVESGDNLVKEMVGGSNGKP